MSTATEEELGPGQTRPSRIRDWFWAPVVPCMMRVFRAVPVSWLEPMSRFAARLWARWPREREIMRRNFHRILDIDIQSPEGAQLAANVYRNQIICAMESIRAIHQPELVKLEGLAELRETLRRTESAGKGQLMLTAHLGSWEIIGLFAPNILEGSFHELAKPMRIKAFTRHLEKLRRQAGIHVLWNNNKLLLRQMLRTLRAGDSLGLAVDQKPKGLRGPVVDFFGRPTEFVGGPGAVAARTGCAVIAIFCTRLGSFTYRMSTEVLYEASDEERDARKITQTIATAIEQAVRQTPDQWPWTYRRWIYDDDDWQGPRGEKPARKAADNTAASASDVPADAETTTSSG